MFKNKTILITGGTGSFGSSFIDHLLQKKILFKEIRIFSRDEKKQDDLRKYFNSSKIKFYIGDIKDVGSLNTVMKNVDFIFHAAAYKQVPSCEFYPLEAVKTNVIGTENVLQKAIEHNVKKVICLSTDKAVYPINAMGISKAMMEKVAISKSLVEKNKTIICITRYGNVLASRGSVVPTFINQLRNNQPITITDSAMTRFLMPMNEAIELVLYAMLKGNNGDIFIQKTPATSIDIIVKALLKIFDKKSSYKVKIIGSRHGEKKHESLLTAEEIFKAKDLGRYFKVSSDIRDLNYDLYFSKGNKKISKIKEYSSNTVKQLNQNETEKILLNLDFFNNKKKEYFLN
jgi:UDP-N-acetylglucosamine 4,6-dehydratase/5-epimerase